jgi:hypothetical protein
LTSTLVKTPAKVEEFLDFYNSLYKKTILTGRNFDVDSSRNINVVGLAKAAIAYQKDTDPGRGL